jgi:hypothetical protein
LGEPVRPAAEGLEQILAGRYDVTFTARALTEWDRETIGEVPLVDGRFNFSSTKQVCGSGSATVLFADAEGQRKAPERVGDFLSPYGNWLEVTCHITSGPWKSSTILGRFEIGSPQTEDRGVADVGGTRRVTAETIKMRLDDAFLGTKSEPIVGVLQSTVGRSVRVELEELLGLPVRMESRAVVTTLIEYPEDRLKAAFDLVQIVGGVPFMQWDATVGIRPNTWPAPTFNLRDGTAEQAGGIPISSVQVDEWDSTDVKNEVIVTAETADQLPLRTVRRITKGPLRYGSRMTGAWGRRSATYEMPAFDRLDQVEAYADERFAADTLPRAVGVSITMPVDPRLEPGDVGRLNTTTVSGLIRIKSVDYTVGASSMKVSAYLA